MPLCIASAGGIAKVSALAFTLAWTHSVEKTRWEEDWRVTPAGLEIVEARIEGSGAGMDPPDNARFDGKFWRWKPPLKPLPEVLLRRSEAVPQGWTFCAAGSCRQIATAAEKGDYVRLSVCEK
ncbi:MAG: DUF1850 domain-containing protein [Beijerinckiaceae bacterium]